MLCVFILIINIVLCVISGSHGVVHEDYSLLQYSTM
jgi:hypothetical protein